VSGLARTSITQKARQIQNPTAGGVLQRQCACGQHANGGEYEACKQKREGTLQLQPRHHSVEFALAVGGYGFPR